MVEQPVAADLRESPRRPFGVYVLVALLMTGVITAALEIARVHFELARFLVDADKFLIDHSGLMQLAARLFRDTSLQTIANGIIIAFWLLVIAGLWLLQRWAWLVVMVFAGVSLVFGLWRYFEGHPDYIGMVIHVALIFYLHFPLVQRASSRRPPVSQP